MIELKKATSASSRPQLANLPPIYVSWLDAALAGPLPAEGKASCHDCAMCSHQTPADPKPTLYFNSDTKCCTYLPNLPNFLVGRILCDDDPALAAGRATVEARLAQRVAVTPLGLGVNPAHTLLYRHSSAAFGQSATLRCPHYLEESGSCGIWQHRNAVCATWFCKHERGAVGQAFWQTLYQLLTTVEAALSRWSILQLDIGPSALQRLFPPAYNPPQTQPGYPKLTAHELDTTFDQASYQRSWGNWMGRESAFYQECARLVNALTWEEIIVIGGPEVQVYWQLAQQAYTRLISNELAPSLKVGRWETMPSDKNYVQINSYSQYDPLRLPRRLANLLPYFDGRSTEEVLSEIKASEGISLSPELVRKLADFNILGPAEEATERS